MPDDYRKIDIDLYVYGGKQDIELWLKRYTRAVNNMLADDATADIRKAAYLKYIGTKLDDFALQIYEHSANQANWPELSKELISKLSDPAKAQKFRDQIDFIKWDGEVPLHSYENTIVNTTSTLDPDLKENDNLFQRETFKRFMAGLPPDYQTYIDMGMPMRSHDITLARQRAEKYQDILYKNLGRNPLASWAAPAAAQPLAGFAAFKENTAIQSLNDQISLLNLAQKENLEMQRETNKSITSLVEHLTTTSRNPPQDNYRPRYRTPSRERPYQNNNRQYRDDDRQYGNRQHRDNDRQYGNRQYQDNNRQYQDNNRQYGNRSNYSSPYRSPSRSQYDDRGRNGGQERNRPRYDQSHERERQAKEERKREGNDSGRSDDQTEQSNKAHYGSDSQRGREQKSDREQTQSKKIDFKIPADDSGPRDDRQRRQNSPYPSDSQREDF